MGVLPACGQTSQECLKWLKSRGQHIYARSGRNHLEPRDGTSRIAPTLARHRTRNGIYN